MSDQDEIGFNGRKPGKGATGPGGSPLCPQNGAPEVNRPVEGPVKYGQDLPMPRKLGIFGRK